MKYKNYSILLLIALIFTFNAYSQFSCETAVVLTDGYTASNITTPGNGAGSPEAWVTNSPDCQGTGGFSSTIANSTCWNQVFDSQGDDYVFSYTTGEVAGESVYFEIETGQNYMGIKAFTDCTGTSLDGCLSGAYAAGNIGATLSVSATDLEANQTIYFGVGVWSTPNDLAFDVTDFSVTLPTASVNDFQNDKAFKIYPNPTEDILTISHNTEFISSLIVFNMLGQKVVEKMIDNSQQTLIDASKFSKGTYFLKVKTQDGSVQTLKFIKQ